MAKLPQGWVECEFEDVLQYIQPTKYIVNSTNYDDNYKTPVLTAGKSFILGYTNEVNDIFTDYPVIIFDDFTTATKYVDFPFKVKSSAMKILKPYKYVNLLFLYYLMQTIHHNAETHKRYWISEYTKRKIPFPPFNEQMRIVEKIESEFAKIDEGVEHLKNAKEQIKQYRQSVLKFAFEGKLYKTSEWAETTLGEVVEPRRERITPNDKNGNMVFIGMDCIEPNSLYIHKQYKLKETKSVAFVFYKNDVLYGRMRSYLNKVWEATCNGTASAEFIVFPENDNIFSSYLKYLLHQQNFVKYATRNASGDRPRVKFESDLADYKFRLPSLGEQKKIVEEIEKRFAVADEVERVVEDNIEKAKQLKQSILKKAFEGRLVPQDPTDEPASTLLEKIKQERSENAKI